MMTGVDDTGKVERNLREWARRGGGQPQKGSSAEAMQWAVAELERLQEVVAAARRVRDQWPADRRPDAVASALFAALDAAPTPTAETTAGPEGCTARIVAGGSWCVEPAGHNTVHRADGSLWWNATADTVEGLASRAAALEHRRETAPDEDTARAAADELHRVMDEADASEEA